jgi:hypothetical protein
VEETEALENRYSTALATAIKNGAAVAVDKLEAAMRKSSAVITISVDVLKLLSTNDNALFTNYHQAVRAQVRRSAKLPFDQQRCAVDGKMWGSAGDQIRYAALSLDGSGLASYGSCFVTLRESHIAHRASVLECNTFDFLERITPGQELPLGYRSSWAERNKVAVSKCATELKPGTQEKDFPQIILKSTGDRAQDEFIEVHIYGTFDMGSVDSIKVAKAPRNRSDTLALKIVKDIAKKAGKGWDDAGH